MKNVFKIKYLFVVLLLIILVGCSENATPKVEITEITSDINLAVGEKNLIPVDTIFEFTCENEEIASVDGDEIVANKEGKTIVTIQYDNQKIKYNVNVYQETITIKNELENDTLYVLKGKTINLDYETTSKKNCNIVVEEGTVASINENTLYGEKDGTTLITLKSFNVTKQIKLVVIDNEKLLNCSSDTMELLLGDKGLITLTSNTTGSLQEALANLDYEYKNFDSEILSVNEHGYLEALKSGVTQLTIKDKENEKTVEITVREKFMNYDITNENMVNLYGRIIKDTKKKTITVYNSGSGFECTFKGSTFKATINSNCTLAPCAYVKVYLDGTSYSLPLDQGAKDYTYTLASDLSDGFHTIKVVKRTEEWYGQLIISGIEAEEIYNPGKKPELKIEVYGDSITSGYGIYGVSGKDTNAGDIEDGTASYAYVASEILNAQINMYCYQGISLSAPGWYDFLMKDIYRYYSNSNHKLWDFSQYVPDIVIIYLGANDNYGINTKKTGTVAKFKTDYRYFINKILENAPNAQVICCYGLLNMNSELVKVIKSLPDYYKDGNVHTIEFSPNSSGGNGHPNAASQKVAGEKLAQYIQDNILNKTE